MQKKKIYIILHINNLFQNIYRREKQPSKDSCAGTSIKVHAWIKIFKGREMPFTQYQLSHQGKGESALLSWTPFTILHTWRTVIVNSDFFFLLWLGEQSLAVCDAFFVLTYYHIRIYVLWVVLWSGYTTSLIWGEKRCVSNVIDFNIFIL